MRIHQIKIDFNVTEQIKRYVFVYLIEGKHCYLVDSGVSGSEIIIEEYMKSIGRCITDIKAIFLTHAHPDHIGTAAYFQEKVGCDIYAGKGEQRWIENIDLEFQERPIPNFYKLAGKSAKVTDVVTDGDRITLDEVFEVQVIGTPGHSVDEMSYVIGNAAFIGDTVPIKGDIPIYMNKENTVKSLEKIADLQDITAFYPAWDTTYTYELMNQKLEEAQSLVVRLDKAVEAAKIKYPNGDLKIIVQEVCQIMNMPFLMQNPLFQQTINSHM